MFSLMWFLSTYILRSIKKLKTPLKTRLEILFGCAKIGSTSFLLRGHFNLLLSASNLFIYQVTTTSEIASNGIDFEIASCTQGRSWSVNWQGVYIHIFVICPTNFF